MTSRRGAEAALVRLVARSILTALGRTLHLEPGEREMAGDGGRHSWIVQR